MAKIQKTEQASQRSPEELAKLRERQRKQQENINWLNAQAPRPATWTIGIVNAITKHGPRKEVQ